MASPGPKKERLPGSRARISRSKSARVLDVMKELKHKKTRQEKNIFLRLMADAKRWLKAVGEKEAPGDEAVTERGSSR